VICRSRSVLFFMMLTASIRNRSAPAAVIHIGAHAVQHAREIFGALQQRVDRDDDVGEELALL